MSTKANVRDFSIFMVLLTLFLGSLGAGVGYAWAAPSLTLPLSSRADLVWVMGWTAIGSIQGACLAPAFCLGLGRELAGWSRLVLCAGSLSTSMVALSVWRVLGRGGQLSLAIACGLLLMCALPLCAYCFARRDLSSHYPAGV